MTTNRTRSTLTNTSADDAPQASLTHERQDVRHRREEQEELDNCPGYRDLIRVEIEANKQIYRFKKEMYNQIEEAVEKEFLSYRSISPGSLPIRLRDFPQPVSQDLLDRLQDLREEYPRAAMLSQARHQQRAFRYEEKQKGDRAIELLRKNAPLSEIQPLLNDPAGSDNFTNQHPSMMPYLHKIIERRIST